MRIMLVLLRTRCYRLDCCGESKKVSMRVLGGARIVFFVHFYNFTLGECSYCYVRDAIVWLVEARLRSLV